VQAPGELFQRCKRLQQQRIAESAVAGKPGQHDPFGAGAENLSLVRFGFAFSRQSRFNSSASLPISRHPGRRVGLIMAP
jgi:hypothetical protein